MRKMIVETKTTVTIFLGFPGGHMNASEAAAAARYLDGMSVPKFNLDTSGAALSVSVEKVENTDTFGGGS